MIIQKTGKISNEFYVVGSASVPVYFLDGPVPVLFDAGLTGGAFLYEAGIRQIEESGVGASAMAETTRVCLFTEHLAVGEYYLEPDEPKLGCLSNI